MPPDFRPFRICQTVSGNFTAVAKPLRRNKQERGLINILKNICFVFLTWNSRIPNQKTLRNEKRTFIPDCEI